MRSFVSVKDFSGDEICAVIRDARELKSELSRGALREDLHGQTLAMIFQKPSLRTRVSFETAMTQLGGHAIYLAPADVQLGKRETTEDIAMVMGRYAQLIMARVFGHDIVVDLARHAGVPVINGLSDFEHPCQIMADLMTIDECRGRLQGVRAVFAGDGNNVAHSLMYGAARTGMHLTVVTPPGFEPTEIVLTEAQTIGTKSGAQITVTNDLRSASRGAEVIYTDVWASMGQEQEAISRREKFQDYQVNKEIISLMDDQPTILHCLPAHYGDEIDYETSRAAGSAIFDQAENRLHAQKAILLMLTGKTDR